MDIVGRFGQRGLRWIEALGNFVRFSSSIVAWMIRGPGRFARQETMVQMYEVGVLSLPVVMITGIFIGAVLAIEAYPQFQSIGLSSRLGGVINNSVVKQIGPVLTAVMLAGRVGGALTAELGTMRVTEQIDALRVMASNPIRTLAVPRFTACLLMLPVLTVFSDLLGMWGGWYISVRMLGVESHAYWEYSKSAIDLYTINTGFLKSFFFGAAIASVACYKGFNCGAGAQGVGRACTEAFVASFVSILVMNFFLAMLLNSIYQMIWPNSVSIF